MRKPIVTSSVVMLLVLSAGIARAQNACTAARMLDAAKLTFCQSKCNAKVIKKGGLPPETGGLGCRNKCVSKHVTKKFAIELKYGDLCPAIDWLKIEKRIDDSGEEHTCQGGSNNLEQCAEASECPGGACVTLKGLVPDLDCALTNTLLGKSKCSSKKSVESREEGRADGPGVHYEGSGQVSPEAMREGRRRKRLCRSA
jgi:hypothetical protein